MGKDYYTTLNITRSANDSEIKAAYRKIALNFHPIKNPSDKHAVEKFKEAAEAYDVLSNHQRKAIYDQFGEEGLKSGIPVDKGSWSESYSFCGEPNKIFHEFFGGDNPFADFIHHAELDKTENFGGLAGRGRKKQDMPIERDLMLSLEEVYHGCVKKMKISRRVMNDDAHTSSFREKILTITVKRGWKAGTRITFEQEGDQGPNSIPADIVFVVRDKVHPIFRREGLDLVFTQKLPLALALIGTTIHVPTLDGRVLDLPITDIVKPGFTRVIPGEGMPTVEDPNVKGNLVVEFDIEFPKSLNTYSKEYIKQALIPNAYKKEEPVKSKRPNVQIQSSDFED